jgi:biopolymer transport protein ExbB/biopolymer transport protein TolQ
MHGMIDVTSIGGIALGVLVTLGAMSVASIGILLERSWSFRLGRRQSRRCATELAWLLRQGKVPEALAAAEAANRSPVARVLAAGLVEWQYQTRVGEDPTSAAVAAREATRQAASMAVAELRRGLSALATIGATAPFVGLLGTTFGIINAFRSIATTGASNMATISGGISEALITTAFGLFVAIPAVWAYNALSGRVEGFAAEMDRSGYQLVDHLLKQAH